MSGFLAALLGRDVGRLPVLERRPRSLFEPLAGRPAVAPRGADEDDASEPREASLSAPAGRSAAPTAARQEFMTARWAGEAPAPARRDEAVAAQAHRGPVPPHAALLPPRPVPMIARRDASETQRSDRAVMVSSVQHQATARRIDALVSSPESTPPSGSSSHSSSSRSPASRSHTGPDDHRVGDAPLSPPKPTAVGSRERVPAAAAATRAAATLAPMQSPRPRPAVLLARSQNAAVSKRDAPGISGSPAAVQISIGRVEIRAVQAPADTPRRGGPAAPRLSLDAYLRGRNGAAR